jgi:hypothetical protein
MLEALIIDMLMGCSLLMLAGWVSHAFRPRSNDD